MLWKMKERYWSTPAHLVAPSHWLAVQLEQSSLCSSWPIRVIPNALDTTVFRPIEQTIARDLLGIPRDTPVILFGALSGTGDPRKGWDLLESSIPQVLQQCPDLHLIVLGGLHGAIGNIPAERIFDLGQLTDDQSLTLAYSSADCVVVPSRLDILPQVATEAQACGTLVVGFRTSGLADCVEHQGTGYLAEPFSPEALAEGVVSLLQDDQSRSMFGNNARSRAVALWSNSVVAEHYRNLYREVLNDL
jgi:glycosyltransferase involved in cell wall biosynthesis